MIRIFICIELPPEVKARIAKLQADLKNSGQGVRWSRPDGIHLTLKFLGDVEKRSVADIGTCVAAACASFSPFTIRIDETGAFPDFKRPRVFWLGLKEPGELLVALYAALEDQLQEIGFDKERRPYSPHLTIGRLKYSDGLYALCKAFQETHIEPMTFRAGQVVVMQSQLRPSGSLYTPLKVIDL